MGMPILLVLVLGAVAVVGYKQNMAKAELERRIVQLERRVIQDGEAISRGQQLDTELASDIDVVTKKVGITAQELDRARKVAEQLREEQERDRLALERAKELQDQKLAEAQAGLTSKQTELAKQLETKAGRTEVAADLATARAEAAARTEAVQKAADTRIGAVQGDVRTVASNLDTTRQDLADSRRDLVEVKSNLTQQIAKNSTELNDLRKKGERDFFDIDITKDKKTPMKRVADIQIGLQDTDIKNHRFGIIVQVDENRLEKKDQLVNQPIQFLVGRDKLRYELVVNSVEKDRIRGYLSIPKDKTLSAERPAPAFR
jgi:chromosome segregation ATPase